MLFTFEESEFINAFADSTEVPDKNEFIERLTNSHSVGEDPDLTVIADSTIAKLKVIDQHTFVKMLSNLPVDNFTLY